MPDPRLLLVPLFVSLALTSPAVAANAQAGESFPDFAADGAWCWFSDPRALAHEGHTYAGWVTSDGSIEVGAWNHESDRINTHVLHPEFERDDHDHPALLVLPDGRIAAFYALHAAGDMRLRITTQPGDISAWTAERELGFEQPELGRQGTTYAHPVVLADEDDALYVFWRGSDFKPKVSVSTDLGQTWTAPRTLLARPGADNSNRPYLKVGSDGLGRIDFVYTDGHPRNEPTNSVYYLRYERESFFRADGTEIGSFDDLPLDPALGDRIYDGATRGRAWVWDTAMTATGQPIVAFTRHPDENDHHYMFAIWEDGAWRTSDICPAGGWFPQTPPGTREREPHYSGGVTIDRTRPFSVYTSRRIDGVFEIERWHSEDRGRTWTAEAVTTGSDQDNVRPVAVRNAAAAGPQVLWMSNERYVHYTDFNSAVKAAGADLGATK